MKNFFTKRNIYITLFAMLYISTALVSTIHAVSFFCLANALVLGVLLAVTFEIGQAATLFSILTSKKDRSKAMPWILMTILTTVQILGNVFSSYKYLITYSADQLKYFKEPIFVWMELPDQQANVILTYIIGAILPICALALTSMLTNYLEDNPNSPEPQQTQNTDENTNTNEIINEIINESPTNEEKNTPEVHEKNDIIPNVENNINILQDDNTVIEDEIEHQDNPIEEYKETTNLDDVFSGEPIKLNNEKKIESKFINL